MVRSKLREEILKSRSVSGKKTYNRQSKKYVSLLRKTKKAYCSNLNMKNIEQTTIKVFWKTAQSFFPDKSNNFENISLTGNDKLLTDDFEIPVIFIRYFQNLLPNLDLKVPHNLLRQTPENGDEVSTAMSKRQNHPSIKTILEKFHFSFSFKTVSLTEVKNEIKSSDTNKASHSPIYLQKFQNKISISFLLLY